MSQVIPDAEVERMSAIAADMLKGRTDLAEVNGITVDELEAVYSLAHSFYASGKYADAQDLFRFLTLHRHAEPRFWLGLAASCQMTGDVQRAAQSYAVCALLNPADAQVSLRAGECFLAMGDKKTARTALEAAVGVGEGTAEGRPYAARAKLLLAQASGAGGSAAA